MLAETRTAVAGGAEQAAYQLSATDWALRAGVALVFSVFALEKLVGSSWVSLFAAIGFGQGFRYVTGAIQLGGSLLLLFPRTARLGAALIASTMVGAMGFHLTVLDRHRRCDYSRGCSFRSSSRRAGTVVVNPLRLRD